MPDPARIIAMASAFYDSCVLFTATDLGVFAHLAAGGPSDAARVARELDVDERAARLLLDACVALGLLEKDNDYYSNTPEADAFLVAGRPGDLTGALRYNRDVYPAWGKLTDFARSGHPVEPPELHLGADEDRTRTFVNAMHGRAMGIGRAVVPCLDLGGARRLLDVGGGSGAYSVLIAREYPEMECTVLDLPGIVAVSREIIAREGMADRVSVLPGDYHATPFPEGNDAVIFFGVLHQEDPENISELAARAYDALVPGGKVYVMDMMTDSTHTRPKFSALFAVNMALTTDSGWVFSDEEMHGWLREAGFADVETRPLPPPMPHWLVQASRPE